MQVDCTFATVVSVTISTDERPAGGAPLTSPLTSPESWDRVEWGYKELFAPTLASYARAAVALAAPAADAHILDVAAGPGTLALLAAPDVRRVSALDFSTNMIAQLRGEAAACGLSNVDAVVGDGEALPYADATFDAAFSMFGLIFFPDRARGLRELRRVLRPGGRAVVGAWAPLGPDSPLVILFEQLRAALGDACPVFPPLPLGTAEAMQDELASAGFEQIQVAFAVNEFSIPSVEAFWAAQTRANVLFTVVRGSLPEDAWERLSGRMIHELRARLGGGEVRYAQTAVLGLGVRGA